MIKSNEVLKTIPFLSTAGYDKAKSEEDIAYETKFCPYTIRSCSDKKNTKLNEKQAEFL